MCHDRCRIADRELYAVPLQYSGGLVFGSVSTIRAVRSTAPATTCLSRGGQIAIISVSKTASDRMSIARERLSTRKVAPKCMSELLSATIDGFTALRALVLLMKDAKNLSEYNASPTVCVLHLAWPIDEHACSRCRHALSVLLAAMRHAPGGRARRAEGAGQREVSRSTKAGCASKAGRQRPRSITPIACGRRSCATRRDASCRRRGRRPWPRIADAFRRDAAAVRTGCGRGVRRRFADQ